MTSNPTVSVISPSYRGETKLPRLLAAFAAQTDADFELIVVVDGDLDSSADLLRASPMPQLHPIVLPDNQGRVGALNAGFRAARGKILVRCDDDVEPSADFIETLRRSHSESGAAFAVPTRDVLEDSPFARAYGLPRDASFRRTAYSGAVPAWRCWGGVCSVTREMWETVGEYSTAYTAYGWEDVDYGYRLTEAGYDVVLAPDLECDHFGAAATTEARAVRAYEAGAARTVFTGRHPEALPPQTPPTGAWGTLVKGLARRSDGASIARTARRVDRLVPRLPRSVAQKAIALVVEAASLAGSTPVASPRPSHVAARSSEESL